MFIGASKKMTGEYVRTKLTDLCSKYAIQLNQKSGICEVWKN